MLSMCVAKTKINSKQSKVIRLYSALYISLLSLQHSDMTREYCTKEMTQFNLPHTHKSYLPLLPATRRHRPLAGNHYAYQ